MVVIDVAQTVTQSVRLTLAARRLLLELHQKDYKANDEDARETRKDDDGEGERAHIVDRLQLGRHLPPEQQEHGQVSGRGRRRKAQGKP